MRFCRKYVCGEGGQSRRMEPQPPQVKSMKEGAERSRGVGEAFSFPSGSRTALGISDAHG